MEELTGSDYKNWLSEIKLKLRSSQIKASITVNSALIEFYWYLGRIIIEKQVTAAWGDSILKRLSHDLKSEFPEMTGLSERNLKYARQFYQFYESSIGQQHVSQFGQHAVAQIPWVHNLFIISKSRDLQEAEFYVQQTIENN
jgi:predicted nuclease of restriction endonuclease-like (RecB) superfamily